MNRSYLDLVRAAKRGAVRAIVGWEPGYQAVPGRWSGQMIVGDPERPSHVFERPNYDFEHLFDRVHTDWIGDNLYSHCLDEGYNRFAKRAFFLPQEMCAYVFNCVEDYYDFDRTCCTLLQQTEMWIEGIVFFRQEASSGGLRSWLMEAASFRLSPDGAATITYNIPRPDVPVGSIETLNARIAGVVEDVIVATMLVTLPSKAVEFRPTRSVGIKIYNSTRKLGQPRLDAPCIINVDRNLMLSEMADRRDYGTTMCPHERRAHTRVIWRGTEKEREVKVRAASINGGNPMQPYRVKV